MIALIASLFALGIGPLIYQTFGPMRRTDKIASGFILIVITATLVLEVLPETYRSIGFFAIMLALIGFAGPTIIEKLFAKSATKTHLLTIVLGIFGLVVHASIDGAALFNPESSHHHNEQLSLAIILHRLPVGLTIWWLLKPLIGERYALLTLVAMAVATASGYGLSMHLTEYHESNAFAALQAFISGSLLHVILHKPHDDGCMHTSQKHELHHHEEDQKLTNNPENPARTQSRIPPGLQLSETTALLPEKWNLIGMTLGILTMLLLHVLF
ncbi:MAG: hypothetical protein KUG78_08115 [Kangiellaceae bacterium]|nr:hypothetical protein [Kangiellaceae bacterium]